MLHFLRQRVKNMILYKMQKNRGGKHSVSTPLCTDLKMRPIPEFSSLWVAASRSAANGTDWTEWQVASSPTGQQFPIAAWPPNNWGQPQSLTAPPAVRPSYAFPQESDRHNHSCSWLSSFSVPCAPLEYRTMRLKEGAYPSFLVRSPAWMNSPSMFFAFYSTLSCSLVQTLRINHKRIILRLTWLDR